MKGIEDVRGRKGEPFVYLSYILCLIFQRIQTLNPFKEKYGENGLE